MDKGKGQTSRADDECFIEVQKKKSGCNKGGNKNFKQVLVKQKTLYHPKAKQSNEGTSNSPKTTPFVGTKASTSGYNKDCTKSPGNKGNGFLDDINLFSLSNSIEGLNTKNLVIDEVSSGNKAITTDMQGDRQSVRNK
ncbi:hypothetical protein Tco_0556280 [Tanacetum coccineum]